MVSSPSPVVKMHRRHVDLDGRAFTVITLRPSTPDRFATNHFHDTWHVLTDPAGARLLGRLCWWLSFQRRPGTIAMIDGPLLVPNPFDADESSPIVIANADLAPLNRTRIAQLKRHMARDTPSDGTVRLSTGGLDRLLSDGSFAILRSQHEQTGAWWNQQQQRAWTDRINGVVVMAAPPPVLQWWAFELSRLGQFMWKGSNHTELDHPLRRRRDGEVQVFEDFAHMVTQAKAARARLFPGDPRRELHADERRKLWAEMPAPDELGSVR